MKRLTPRRKAIVIIAGVWVTLCIASMARVPFDYEGYSEFTKTQGGGEQEARSGVLFAPIWHKVSVAEAEYAARAVPEDEEVDVPIGRMRVESVSLDRDAVKQRLLLFTAAAGAALLLSLFLTRRSNRLKDIFLNW